MGNLIPFFRYDILARIIPGAFTLCCLAYAGVEIPGAWDAIFESGPKAGTIPGGAVVVPLVCAGACYAIGLFYEVAFATRPLSLIADGIISGAYASAKEKKEDDDKAFADEKASNHERAKTYKLWSDLVHEDAKEGERFAHAHRFQAEAKMCLHSVIPAFALAGFALYYAWGIWCSQQLWELGLAILLVVILCCGAYAREWRRWLQTLIAADYKKETETDAAGDDGRIQARATAQDTVPAVTTEAKPQGDGPKVENEEDPSPQEES